MPFLPYEEMDTRQRFARELADQGKSYTAIGEILKVSRQRVHQLLTGYKSPASRKKPAEAA